MSARIRIITGCWLDVARSIESGTVNTCVTSPPYWGLRDYGVAGQFGLEATPAEYIARMVEVFREVRRVLRDDGTAWVNMGDGYSRSGGDRPGGGNRELLHMEGKQIRCCEPPNGLKPKDLLGMPWRLAFALQADGWYLRSDIIWHKPNPMPESVTDRPTKAHEYIFLLSKSERYHYDAAAIYEPVTGNAHDRARKDRAAEGHKSNPDAMRNGTRPAGVNPKAAAVDPGDHKGPRPKQNSSFSGAVASTDTGKRPMPPIGGVKHAGNNGNATYSGEQREWPMGRNARSVWRIPTQAYSGAHFATFPEELAKRCILAGCPVGGLVLDPFTGAGTTALVAMMTGRRFVGAELNPEYAEMARARLQDAAPLFAKEPH